MTTTQLNHAAIGEASHDDATEVVAVVMEKYAAQSAVQSWKRARYLFPDCDIGEQHPLPPMDDPNLRQMALDRRRRQRGSGTATTFPTATSQSQLVVASKIIRSTTNTTTGPSMSSTSDTAITTNTTTGPSMSSTSDTAAATATGSTIVSVVAPSTTATPTSMTTMMTMTTPHWHAPWKLSTVLSSHLGWVRCIAMDPYNRLFATGSADRTIKIWDLPMACAGVDTTALQLTLTGHISAVRGLVFSDRHPYLFSAGEDKTVKCWDLETNQVVRHYHGHLSGVYCLALHPTLDVLVSAGRDAVARVWDMRTKTQVHVLSGHEHTIAAVLTSSTHPQVTTGSHDCTVKLWDLAAGKCFTTLTHHQKSIRAMAAAPAALGERTFVSAAADSIRKWQGKNGRFLHRLSGHGAVLNAVAVQDDGVMVSGGDDGTMHFWDYQSGYSFQQEIVKVQPGSLQQAENGIMALQFDLTGTRLITGEADKSIKIWKQDETASELSHPVDMKAWRKKCIAQSKERF
jgi:pleiotropic regulator 1